MICQARSIGMVHNSGSDNPSMVYAFDDYLDLQGDVYLAGEPYCYSYVLKSCNPSHYASMYAEWCTTGRCIALCGAAYSS